MRNFYLIHADKQVLEMYKSTFTHRTLIRDSCKILDTYDEDWNNPYYNNKKLKVKKV